MKKRIGLMTMHNVCNMGAVLQAYALQRTINLRGGECEIIDYVPNLRKGYRKFFPKDQGISKMKRTLSWIKWLPQRVKWQKPYKEFVDKHLILGTEIFYENKKIYSYPFHYDVYVTGSDQVWNSASTDGLSAYYFLDFVRGRKKVSYAASISNKELNTEEREQINHYLKDFSAISVREYQAVELLGEVCEKEIELVLDPTFLLTLQQWNQLAVESNIEIQERYLLIYMLGDVPEIMKLAKQIAEQKKLKIVKFGWDFVCLRDVDYNISFGKPQDFVTLFKNAEYVITNSFHGTAFSINFNKNFLSIPSSKNNPRFISILELMGLKDRLYGKNNEIIKYLENIDYSKVNLKLNFWREKSLKFIDQNILR